MTDNMKTYKRIVSLGLIVLMCCALFAGCGGKAEPSPAPAEEPKTTEAPAPEPTEKTPAVNAYGLADGVYSAKFDTDSSMFHVNEACEGRGTLTVKNGEMTIHISLASKKITKLFCGKAEDAQKEGPTRTGPAMRSMASTCPFRPWAKSLTAPLWAPRGPGTIIWSASPTPSRRSKTAENKKRPGAENRTGFLLLYTETQNLLIQALTCFSIKASGLSTRASTVSPHHMALGSASVSGFHSGMGVPSASLPLGSPERMKLVR